MVAAHGYNINNCQGGTMKHDSRLFPILICVFLLAGCTITIDTGAGPTQAPPQPQAPPALPSATIAPIPTRTPVILSSGTIDIPQTYMADLDTGAIPKSTKDSLYNEVDLWFEAAAPQERYLETYNGASWAVMGLNPLNYVDCVNMVPTTARMDIRNLPSGTYICMITNSKNISIIRVNSINYGSKGVIRLDFTTWQP